jgi:hypothetical protein
MGDSKAQKRLPNKPAKDKLDDFIYANKQYIYQGGVQPEFITALDQLLLEANIRLLEDLLEIPGKYIDDGTMVYWSDFNAETLEKIIREKIAKFKALKKGNHAEES